jgi:uncharacterized protein
MMRIGHDDTALPSVGRRYTVLTPHILRSAEFVVQPWKNGGGTTTEIAVSPEGATFDTFDWRISMARIEAAGAFSLFPGIDRSIGILEGRGADLHIATRGVVTLDPESAPYAFPGDVPVSATLYDGPILDLNVMTRRGRFRHYMSRVAVTGLFEVKRRGAVTVGLLRGSSASVDIVGGPPLRLEHGDAIVVGDSLSVSLSADGPTVLWIVDLWAC